MTDPYNPQGFPGQQGGAPQGFPGEQGFPGQQGGAPQGFPGQQGFPPVKKRKIWPWALGGSILVLLLLVGSCSFVLFRAVSAPLDAANEYFEDLESQSFSEAYESQCAVRKSSESFTAWQSSIGADVTAHNFNSSEISGNIATVSRTVTQGGIERPVVVSLRQENGEWKMCSGF